MYSWFFICYYPNLFVFCLLESGEGSALRSKHHVYLTSTANRGKKKECNENIGVLRAFYNNDDDDYDDDSDSNDNNNNNNNAVLDADDGNGNDSDSDSENDNNNSKWFPPLTVFVLQCNLLHYVNALSPKGDQHQFSPNNISRSSTVKVMRITKLITKGNMLWSNTKFSQLLFKELYGGQCGEFVCGSLGLKGLRRLAWALVHLATQRTTGQY